MNVARFSSAHDFEAEIGKSAGLPTTAVHGSFISLNAD
jgi:hypothetical protein